VGASGCQGHECVGQLEQYVSIDGGDQGHLIAPDLWESTRLDAPWLHFPGQEAYALHIPEWGPGPGGQNRTFVEMHAYVSNGQNPGINANQPNLPPLDNWTEGTGNIVEFSYESPGLITVKNDTCADFYVRVVLMAGPPGSGDPGYDDGGLTKPDAGPADAAPTDAKTE
jgi:hypothetical protein